MKLLRKMVMRVMRTKKPLSPNANLHPLQFCLRIDVRSAGAFIYSYYLLLAKHHKQTFIHKLIFFYVNVFSIFSDNGNLLAG